MIYMTLTALGVAAWIRLPIEWLPDTRLPSMTVRASYAGASAETVEAFVTSPMEAEIEQVRGVDTVSSTSTAGLSVINVSFVRGTDMNFARIEVSERLSALARNTFPPGANNSPPSVQVASAQADPNAPQNTSIFLRYQINGPYTLEVLQANADHVLGEALRDLPGVLDAVPAGATERTVRLELDDDKLSALNLTANDVRARIAALEYNKELGFVIENGRSQAVTMRQRVDSLGDIRNLTLTDNGALVKIGDVGRIVDTYAEPTGYVRINGFPVVTLTVSREPGTNAVEVADRVKAKVDSLRSQLLPGVRVLLNPRDDQSLGIRGQLEDLSRRSILSAAIIFLVLMLFLQSFRSTIIIFSTITFAILITLNLMYWSGFTLNVYTLMGLAMGFGIMVDHAIVVLENIFRRWRLGESATEAAEHGAREVALAVFTGTLTTVVVFIPFVYLQGNLRIYYLPLAIVVGLSQIASLFVAFSFIPALGSKLLTAGAAKHLHRAAVPAGSTVDVGAIAPPRRSWYVRLYSGLLGVTLRFPWMTVAVALLMLGGSYYVFNKYVTRGVGFSGGGGGFGAQSTVVNVRFTMQQGEELARTDGLARFFEERLRNMPEVGDFTSTVTQTTASISITFPDSLEFTYAPEAVCDQMMAYATNFAGPSISVSCEGRGFSSPSGAPTFGSQTISVSGYNFDRVREYAQDIAQRLAYQTRVQNIDISGTGNGRQKLIQLVVDPDRQRLALHNLSVQQFMQQVNAATAGNAAQAPLNVGGEDLMFNVKLKGFNTLTTNALGDVTFTTNGSTVRFGDLARVEEQQTPSDITRKNQQYHRNVTYDFRGPAKLADRVRKGIVDNYTVPPGYKVVGQADFQVNTRDQRQIYGVLTVSLILIFMVTAALFESIRQPVCVLLTVPMAMIGVFLLFFYIGATFTREAYIGVIMMGGIVVNNSILIVDRINQLRRLHGVPLADAIVQGTLDRVRPILMTAFVTVAGMLPLVLFSRTVNTNIWNAFGYALIGGLSSSTVLALGVTPAIYLLFERRKEKRALARKNYLEAMTI